MTVRELLARLCQARNMDAVVCLCERDREYMAFGSAIDESHEDAGDGVIGSFLLTLGYESAHRAAYQAILEGFEDSDGVIREVPTKDLLEALVQDSPSPLGP